MDQQKFKRKRINLENKYDPYRPKIPAVFDQIKQVILSLLQNAEEAVPSEGGITSITTRSYSSVMEIGIDSEIYKKYLSPFLLKSL